MSMRCLRGIFIVGLAASMVLSIAPGCAGKQVQEQNPDGPAKKLIMAEYNDFTRAVQPKDPEDRIKQLDDFVRKHPDSTFLGYVYEAYYHAYEQLGNLPKVMEYAEKRLAVPSPFQYQNRASQQDRRLERLKIVFVWAEAYNTLRSDDPKLARRARDVIRTGLTTIAEMEKPPYWNAKSFSKSMERASTTSPRQVAKLP